MKYKLFAGNKQRVNNTYCYEGQNSPYMLVYDTDIPNDTFREIPLDKEKNLKSDELVWLREIKRKINTEFLEDTNNDNSDFLLKIMCEFEKELKKEEQKYAKRNKENE